MNNADMPAMPVALAAPTNDGYLSTDGLSKRELFAMAAMQAIITGVVGNSEVMQAVVKTCAEKGIDTDAYMAKSATEYADALLTQLSKEPQA